MFSIKENDHTIKFKTKPLNEVIYHIFFKTDINFKCTNQFTGSKYTNLEIS